MTSETDLNHDIARPDIALPHWRSVLRAIRFTELSCGKVTLCLVLLLAGVLTGDVERRRFYELLAAITAVMAFGYVGNNWADRHDDASLGRQNAFIRMPPWRGRLVVGLMFAVAVGAVLALGKSLNGWLAGAQLALAAAYSLEPIRLKGRGWLGLVCAVAAQYIIPAVMVSCNIAETHVWDAAFISLLLIVTGATLEVGHQNFDRDSDRATGVRTAVLGIRPLAAERIYRGLLLTSGVLIALLPIYIALRFMLRRGLSWESLLMLLPVAVVIQLLLVIWRHTRGAPQRINDPFYQSQGNVVDRYYTSFPNFFLPLYLGTSIAILLPDGLMYLASVLVWIRLTFHDQEMKWFWSQLRSLLRAPELSHRVRVRHAGPRKPWLRGQSRDRSLLHESDASDANAK